MRLLGINIPDNKRIEIALTYLYGIGRLRSRQTLVGAKINFDKRTKELTQEELNRIRNWMEQHYQLEGELRHFIRQNIQRLKELQTYKGNRHLKHLPVRGQRTKTNSRTVRGNVRKTVGSGKRKAELK